MENTAESPLVQRSLAELRQARAATLLALAPLARADVGDLVRAVLGPGVEARRAGRPRTRGGGAPGGDRVAAPPAPGARGGGRGARGGHPPPRPRRLGGPGGATRRPA